MKKETQKRPKEGETGSDTRKLWGRKEKDLLWSGGRTIKEAYSQTSSLYSELSKTLEDLVSGLPEGGLNLADKYKEVSMYSKIISEYYRQKSKEVSKDVKLADSLYSPGWETMRVLSDLPAEIHSEIKQDLQEEGDSPTYGTAISILREVGKIIKDYLPTLRQEDGTIFTEEEISPVMGTKEDYILQDRVAVLRVLQILKDLGEEVKGISGKVSSTLREKLTDYSETASFAQKTILGNLERYHTNINLAEAQRRHYNTEELISALLDLLEEKDQLYSKREVDGETLIIEYEQPQERSLALEELQKLSDLPKSSMIAIPKDFANSRLHTEGDLTEIGSQEVKEKIEEYQKKGQLLWTIEGLSGGKAYFKSFSIVLAKILNEQSKFYHTEETGSGVSMEVVSQILGESANVERTKFAPLKGGNRPFPYIIVSYERIAKEMSKTGKISGGKDIEYIRNFINGGYTKFEKDPKTGKRRPVKNSYVPGLTSKKYPLSNGTGKIIWLPFIVNEAEITDVTKKDSDVGCILRLTPQYSNTLQKFTAYRSDTIQLIGGGNQKEITMDLLDYLVYARGVNKNKKEKNSPEVLRVKKKTYLKKYENMDTYKKGDYIRKREIEKDFQTAIQKCIDAKILLPGKTRKGGLNGYREEKTPGGEIISVFIYNPDYLKGETLPPEDQ